MAMKQQHMDAEKHFHEKTERKMCTASPLRGAEPSCKSSQRKWTRRTPSGITVLFEYAILHCETKSRPRAAVSTLARRSLPTRFPPGRCPELPEALFVQAAKQRLRQHGIPVFCLFMPFAALCPQLQDVAVICLSR